jgi:hypothetical protein
MSFPETLPSRLETAGGSTMREKSRKAKTSLTLGLLSFILSIVTGVPAVITGFLSLREIGRSGGRVQGKRLALAGIVLGLVGSLSSGSLVWYTVVTVRRAAQRIDIA